MADADHDDAPGPPGEEYGLAPSAQTRLPQPPTYRDYEEIVREAVEPPEPPEPTDLRDERFQFTLAEMMWLFVAASVFFSAVSLLPRSAESFAGAMGLLVLVLLVVVESTSVSRPVIRLGMWLALAFYLLACVAALALA